MEIIFARIAVILAAIFGIEDNLTNMQFDEAAETSIIQEYENLEISEKGTDGGLRLGEKFSAR
jgi:hypothetical protein